MPGERLAFCVVVQSGTGDLHAAAFGDPQAAWAAAADVAAETHVRYLDAPVRRVLSLIPRQVRGHVDRRQGLLQGRADRRRRRPGRALRAAHPRGQRDAPAHRRDRLPLPRLLRQAVGPLQGHALGRPRALHAPARRRHLRRRRRRAPARHRHARHRHPRGAGPRDQPRLPRPGARSTPTPGRPTPTRWSCRRPARSSTACAENVHASPRDVHSPRPPHARCFRHERAFLPHPSAGPHRADRTRAGPDRSRACASGTCISARRTSTGSATSTSASWASTWSPRRVTCPAGGRRATSCSCRPAATTTTSASTPGSPPGAAPSPTASPGLHHVALNFPTKARLADIVAAADRRRTRRSASSPTTARTWRSTSPIRTATTSSSRGTAPSTSGRRYGDAARHRRSTPSSISTTCSPTRADAVLSQRLQARRPARRGPASVRRGAPGGPPRRGRRPDRRLRSGRSGAGRAAGELPGHPDRGRRPQGRPARGRPGRRRRLPHRRDVRGVRPGRRLVHEAYWVNEVGFWRPDPDDPDAGSCAPGASRTPRTACPSCRT